MADSLTESLSLKEMEKLTHFKEYAVSHPQLAQVDRVLMRAIREPAGFAHVLVYGPSGVGKTTMIGQIAVAVSGDGVGLSWLPHQLWQRPFSPSPLVAARNPTPRWGSLQSGRLLPHCRKAAGRTLLPTAIASGR